MGLFFRTRRSLLGASALGRAPLALLLVPGLLAFASAGCSVFLDKNDAQCKRAEDCAAHPGTTCDVVQRVCVAVPPDAGDSGPSCTPVHPPSAPVIVSSPDSLTLTFVINTIDFGDTPVGEESMAYETLGYDLDGLCTTATGNWGCVPPAWATGGDPTDMRDGRDNSVDRMVYIFGQGLLTSQSCNEAMAAGERPVGILRLTGYSGLPADDKATLEWFLPLSAVPAGDAGAGAWTVDEDSTTSTDGGPGAFASTLVDHAAYVVGNVLVGHFEDVSITVRDSPTAVHDVWLTAELRHDEATDQWSLGQGVLAGRTPIASLLGLLPSVINKILKVPVCTDSYTYPSTKQMICGNTDILMVGEPDPAATCDAMSIGIGFTAVPGALGAAEARTDPKLCPDALDPKQDTCGSPP
jgi:hypothetical protein